jgi:hypothetical protein
VYPVIEHSWKAITLEPSDAASPANLSITEFIQILIDKNWVIDVVECKNGWLEFDTRDDLDRYEANSKLKSIFNWDHFK